VSFDVYKRFRESFSGTLMINGGLSIESAVEYLQNGCADLASFGCLFVANANLPALVAAGVATDSMNSGGLIGTSQK
jgi:2,4-dienoyl-CoA reductase-like NADH-dependent reductase (Old Yellow Enzyme family)